MSQTRPISPQPGISHPLRPSPRLAGVFLLSASSADSRLFQFSVSGSLEAIPIPVGSPKISERFCAQFSSVSLCIFLDFSLTFAAEWREPAQSKGVSQEQRENKGKRLQQQQQSAAFREGRLPTVVKWPMPHSCTGRERQGRGDSRRKREHHSGRRGSHIYATRRRPACN